jgi:hypothetical protein
MIYFAVVSHAEVRQRIRADDSAAWNGFLGVGDPVSDPLPRESRRLLQRITRGEGDAGTEDQRREYAAWVANAIAPRNIAGLADPARHNLYPVDVDTLTDRHAKLELTREDLIAALPALRGMAPEPAFR